MGTPMRVARFWLDASRRSGSEPKDVFDESDLLSDVALCQPANLSFADHVRRFIALDGPFPAGERAEAKARLDAPFDSTVILLDDISTTTQQEGSRRALYQCSQRLARHEILLTLGTFSVFLSTAAQEN